MYYSQFNFFADYSKEDNGKISAFYLKNFNPLPKTPMKASCIDYISIGIRHIKNYTFNGNFHIQSNDTYGLQS